MENTFQIPYASTGSFGAIFLDYLNEEKKLKPFYTYSPNISSFESIIADRKKQSINRAVLVQVLKEQYQNIDAVFNASGLEVEAMVSFAKQFSLNANYTNTRPDERFAMRIPEHKANALLAYTIEKGYVSLNYQFVGDREDSFFNNDTFTTDVITLDSFSTLDLTLAREVGFTDDMRVFLNLSNILNEDYQELYRYQTRGRNITVGFTLGL